MSRYHHFQNTDPGQWRRKLTWEQAERVVSMKDERGLTFGAIAAWFTRNVTPVDYYAVRTAYNWAKRSQREAA